MKVWRLDRGEPLKNCADLKLPPTPDGRADLRLEPSESVVRIWIFRGCHVLDSAELMSCRVSGPLGRDLSPFLGVHAVLHLFQNHLRSIISTADNRQIIQAV